MSIVEFMTVIGYSLTIFSAGIAVGKFISTNKNDRR